MTNTELKKIRKERNLSKGELAKFLGITPMLLGRYEKGSCAIPDEVAEKLQANADGVVATEIEVKKTTRKGGRKAKEKAAEIVAEVKETVGEKAIAAEIEVKKSARKTGRKVKEAAEAAVQSDPVVAAEIEVKKNSRKAGRKAKEVAAEVKEAVEDKVVAEEIEVKKTARKGARKAKETVSAAKGSVKKAAGVPNIIIQSPMGGYITPADIAKKVPKNTEDVYVRVDENKLYYVLKNGESGDVDIWE